MDLFIFYQLCAYRGRRLTPQGQRDLDRIAGQVLDLILLFQNFVALIFSFKINFSDSLTINGENGTPAADTLWLAGWVWNYITMVRCLAPSCENTPVHSFAQLFLLLNFSEV